MGLFDFFTNKDDQYVNLLSTDAPQKQTSFTKMTICLVGLMLVVACTVNLIKPETAAVNAYSLGYKTTDIQCSYTRILGAAWGTDDVTRTVANLYNNGVKTILASEEVFGKTTDGI